MADMEKLKQSVAQKENQKLHFVKVNFNTHVLMATSKEDALDRVDYEDSDVVNWKGSIDTLTDEVIKEGEIEL